MVVPEIGDTVRFTFYDARGCKVVAGPVTRVRRSRKNGKAIAVYVDLTSLGAGGVVVPIERVEVLA